MKNINFLITSIAAEFDSETLHVVIGNSSNAAKISKNLGMMLILSNVHLNKSTGHT